MPIRLYEAFVGAWRCLRHICCLPCLEDRPNQPYNDLKYLQFVEEGQSKSHTLSSSNSDIGWLRRLRWMWSPFYRSHSEDKISLQDLDSVRDGATKHCHHNNDWITLGHQSGCHGPVDSNVSLFFPPKPENLTEEKSVLFAAVLAKTLEAERANIAFIRGLCTSRAELSYLGRARIRRLAAAVQEANSNLRDAIMAVKYDSKELRGNGSKYDARKQHNLFVRAYEQFTGKNSKNSKNSNASSYGSEGKLIRSDHETESMYDIERALNHLIQERESPELRQEMLVQLSERSNSISSVNSSSTESKDDSNLDIPSIVVRNRSGSLSERSINSPSTRCDHESPDASDDSWYSRKLSSDNRYQSESRRTSWELTVQYDISAEICFAGGQFLAGTTETIGVKQNAYSIYESNAQIQTKREVDLAVVLDQSAPAADRQSSIPEMCNDEDTSYTVGQFVTSWMLQVYAYSWLEFSHYLLFTQRETETDAIVSYLGYVHFNTLVRAMWFYDGTSEVRGGAQSLRPSRSSVTDDVPLYIHQIYVHGSDKGSHAMEHLQLVRQRQPPDSPEASNMAQARLSSYSSDQNSVSSTQSAASSGVFSPPRRVGTKLTDFGVDQDCSMY